MGKIQLLPPELINQIAAGEVVERPSSVVKELVENAIDADATRIEVSAAEGGRQLRVADNGCGMEQADLEVAFRNHATSKVRQLDDLFHLETLGFRGEALASIAAIGKVTCISRPQDGKTGLKALVQASGEVALQETGCAPGTIFEVRELFYNVPARLKFLKRPQTELAHIQETLQMLALSHPEIAFQLHLEESPALKTSGSGDIGKAVSEVFSLGESDTLLPFSLTDPEFGYRAWGQTSTPETYRSSKKWMMTFVNRRAVKCPILSKAIESAYTSLITPGKFPVTVLFLELPPEEVDVNVHPTKKEVKYQRANTLFSFVRKALADALGSTAPAQTGHLYTETPRRSTGVSSPEGFRPPVQQSFSDTSKSLGASHPPVAPRLNATPQYNKAALELYTPQDASLLADFSCAPPQAGLPQRPDQRVIGQLAKTYILLEQPEGLLIVDQHIAAERVLFEQFKDQAEQSRPVSQSLLIPITLPVSPLQADSLEENREAFESLGFTYTVSDGNVSFSAIPSLYNEKVAKTSLQGLLGHLEETGEVRLDVDDVIATAACHSAVRAGDVLNHEQMTRIVTQWLGCTRPWTCPHGRPVSHTITHPEIMHFFDRPSLPQTRQTPAEGAKVNIF